MPDSRPSCISLPILAGYAAFAAILAGVGCDRLPAEGESAPAGPPHRAIAFTDWSRNGYAAASARTSLEELAATGATHVAFIVTAYQQSARTSVVGSDISRTPSDLAVAAARTHAEALGLASTLKLHVDVDDGTWRGAIDPADPDVWFDTYTAFVLFWADFAEAWGFEEFCFGTELAMLSSAHEARWRDLIADVRDAYGGRLLYAASWDEAERVPFWDALDAVGVDAWFAVTSRRDAGRMEMLAAWQPWLDRLDRLSRRAGKDVVLTEIGYRSCDGAGMDPPNFDGDEPVDLAEQADLYWAALTAIAGAPRIAGICIWEWPAISGSEDAGDYTPRGKPAAEVLRRAWGEDVSR